VRRFIGTLDLIDAPYKKAALKRRTPNAGASSFARVAGFAQSWAKRQELNDLSGVDGPLQTSRYFNLFNLKN
jgi:hypothetical protein